MPLRRDQTNSVVIPVSIVSDTRWTLRLVDPASGPGRGHMSAGVSGSADILSNALAVTIAPDTLVTLDRPDGVVISADTGDTLVLVELVQRVAQTDPPGTYRATLVFEAIPSF
jgi:hypothetical protein